jgi:hypothetical protein
VPSATPIPPTPTLAAIPAGANFIQQFSVTAEGDFPYGFARDLGDNQLLTWASLRNGRGLWQFDLGSAQQVTGVRLYAHRDRDQDTTLLAIEVSADGFEWTPFYIPAGACGETPNCLVIDQDEWVDVPFGPVETRYIRLRSGPTAFAFSEVAFAVLP